MNTFELDTLSFATNTTAAASNMIGELWVIISIILGALMAFLVIGLIIDSILVNRELDQRRKIINEEIEKLDDLEGKK